MVPTPSPPVSWSKFLPPLRASSPAPPIKKLDASVPVKVSLPDPPRTSSVSRPGVASPGSPLARAPSSWTVTPLVWRVRSSVSRPLLEDGVGPVGSAVFDERVVAAQPTDRVVAATAGDRLVELVAGDRVGELAAVDQLDVAADVKSRSPGRPSPGALRLTPTPEVALKEAESNPASPWKVTAVGKLGRPASVSRSSPLYAWLDTGMPVAMAALSLPGPRSMVARWACRRTARGR